MNPMTHHPPSSIQPNADWPSLLEAATREVFEIMLGSSLEPNAQIEDLRPPLLTGMVGLAGATCGVLSVRCQREAAGNMAARMLGHDAAQADDMIADALGEVCNMIAGNFKAKVPGMAEACMLSVPSVISGDNYELRPLTDGERCGVLLRFEGSPIEVVLDVDR